MLFARFFAGCPMGSFSQDRRKELKKLSLGPRDPYGEQGFSGHLRRGAGETVVKRCRASGALQSSACLLTAA